VVRSSESFSRSPGTASCPATRSFMWWWQQAVLARWAPALARAVHSPVSRIPWPPSGPTSAGGSVYDSLPSNVATSTRRGCTSTSSGSGRGSAGGAASARSAAAWGPASLGFATAACLAAVAGGTGVALADAADPVSHARQGVLPRVRVALSPSR
jgi:hypothetical protein